MTAVLAMVAAGCTSDENGDAPTDARTAAPAPRARTDARLELAVAPGSSGAELTATVTAPRGSTQMQVGTDPTFAAPTWRAVASTVTLPVDGGYQEVFARFRTGPDDPDPIVVVAGIDVDLDAEAATADPPRPSAIGLSSPTTLSVVVEVGRVERGGPDREDRLVGEDVDAEDLDDGWELAGAADGTTAPRIVDVRRSTRPTDTGRIGDDDLLLPVRHRVELQLSGPLATGRAFRLTTPLGTTSAFTIDDHTTRSPAVHANQVGYRPGDVSKRAYLTAPLGQGPDAAPTFRVIDVATGATELEGEAVAATPAGDGEVGRGDLTGLDVWALDFSDLDRPGRYRTCVDDLGCSEPYSIDEDATWWRAATTVARGLYHQRSGIALGAPTTSVERPRPDHPDDGLVVHQSSLTALEAADLPDDELFERLVAGATDEVVDGAWGGHFDAGDWDRRSQHLWMVRHLVDLARVAPDRFTSDLNLPESGDATPDVLDEALWTLDLFRRLQRSDGAVRGGVESARFPDGRVPSWKDDLARYAYAPDPWTTFMYAGDAAEMSLALRTIDPDRAEVFARSATAAMAWAEAQEAPDGFAERVDAQRAVAAASMLALTGDARFAQMFAEATPFDDGPQDVLGCNAAELCEAGWGYLWVDRTLTDPAVVANIEQSFVRAATRSADAADTTLFGWCLEDPDVPLVWGLGVGGAPHALTLLRAWLLTGDPRFRATAERCASVTLGANPLDVSYVTGLGATPVRHPLIVDVNSGGLPVWPGTPVYGNHLLGDDTQWVIDHRLRPAGATGNLSSVPYLQSWYDLPEVGPMTEFTVHQSHGPALWVFGVLASTAPVTPG